MLKKSVKQLPKSTVEIEGELSAEAFEEYFDRALKKVGEHVKLDGFRPGKIPDSVLLQHVPEIKILEEMAEMALNEHYPKILEEERIDAISSPKISITKLARKNPLGFKVETAVLPPVPLPDYKKITKETLAKVTETEKKIEVSEEDVENTILDIRKSRARKEHMAEHAHKPARNATHSVAGGEGEPHEHPEPKAEDLPEFNDAFVQELGPFENVEDFKDKLKVNLKLEKENMARERTRLKIIEEIIAKTPIELPEVLVDLELNKILYRMESDITQMGLKFEDYLKHLNKTVEDLKKEFRPDAEKKAKLALVLNEIAKLENIAADPNQVELEVAQILAQYKDADKTRAQMHAENVLTNEKIFQFLENQ